MSALGQYFCPFIGQLPQFEMLHNPIFFCGALDHKEKKQFLSMVTVIESYSHNQLVVFFSFVFVTLPQPRRESRLSKSKSENSYFSRLFFLSQTLLPAIFISLSDHPINRTNKTRNFASRQNNEIETKQFLLVSEICEKR